MVVSFPFTGSLTPLVFVAWIPLLCVEHNISEKRYRSSKVFIHAYITFFIYNIGTTWWVANASEGGATMAIVLNSLFMALTFQFFHFTKRKLKLSFANYTLPFIWIAFEYLHLRWEMSWPWLTVGNVFSITPSWVQWYAITGALGGTLWVIFSNIFFFEALRSWKFKNSSKSRRMIIAGGLFLTIPLSISLVQYYTYRDSGGKLKSLLCNPTLIRTMKSLPVRLRVK